MQTSQQPDAEIVAIGAVFTAVKDLDAVSQARVLRYVAEKLGLQGEVMGQSAGQAPLPAEIKPHPEPGSGSDQRAHEAQESELDGVSPVAVKWMKRCGFTAKQLSSLYSLGADEIDLIAKKVPGKSIRARLHSVVLLKGIAAYLASGAARLTLNQIKETAIHYGAHDKVNFGRDLKGFGADLNGTKESGYTLSSRGFTSAADLIRQLLGEDLKTS